VHKWGGLGEVLGGNELIDSQIDIKFRSEWAMHCSLSCFSTSSFKWGSSCTDCRALPQRMLIRPPFVLLILILTRPSNCQMLLKTHIGSNSLLVSYVFFI
jgi:hypothetical protein